MRDFFRRLVARLVASGRKSCFGLCYCQLDPFFRELLELLVLGDLGPDFNQLVSPNKTGRAFSFMRITELIVGAMFMDNAKSINSATEADVIYNRLDEPTARTIAYYLERSDGNALNDLLWRLFYSALRAKRLDILSGPTDRLTLALDGVYLPGLIHRHCEKCLSRTIDGVEHYYHAFLVACIVDKDEKFSLPVAVIPLENTPGADKQDCELNAAHRLLDFLRRKNPHAKFNLSADGLYLSVDFIAEAVERGHSVTMPLAKENMVIWEVLDVRLGDSQNSFKVQEDDANVTI